METITYSTKNKYRGHRPVLNMASNADTNGTSGASANANNDNAGTIARNRNTNTSAQPKTPRGPKTTFKGDTTDINGHVFQLFPESQNKRQYTKTMKALQRYVNKNCKFAGDLNSLFKLVAPKLVPPIDISADDISNPIKMLKWTEATKTFI